MTQFRIRDRLRSFRYAAAGIHTMLVSQHNAWIHLCATVLVCAAGCAARLPRLAWCQLILAMMAVWTAEALNTALEFLADAATPQIHPLVKKAKDVAAAAVLISAVGAAIVGVLVFWPHVRPLLAGTME
jgi:diacylglycerol kinase (ATP)